MNDGHNPNQPQRPDGNKKNLGPRQPRTFSNRPPRPEGDRKPYGDRPARPFNGPRPEGDRKPYSPRPEGDRKPYGDRPARPFNSPRPEGDRKPYSPRPEGDRKPYGDRPARPFNGPRPEGDRKPYSDRPQGALNARPPRPEGDRRPYGDRPQGSYRERFERYSSERRAPLAPNGVRIEPSSSADADGGTRNVSPSGRSQATAARVVALEALLDVVQGGAFGGLALDERIKACEGISELDTKFATELFYGTLDKRMWLDWALGSVVEQMPDDPISREVLRLSAYQMLCLDRVPEQAVCSQARELMREKNRDELGAFVFGALKSLGRMEVKPTKPVCADKAEEIAIVCSTPKWLVDALMEDHGVQVAEEYLAYQPEHGVVDVHINPTLVFKGEEDNALEQAGGPFLQTALEGAYRVRGDAVRSPAFFNGLITVQSVASQLCAHALMARRGSHILDMCAAPGGKTCYIAAQMGGSGRVYAWDIHPHRVQLITQTAGRLKLENIRTAVHDALKAKEELFGTMDGVLLDAPCSGMGVVHNKPDLKYRLKPDDISRLTQQQSALLESAARYVKTGGILVYSTCTVFTAENAAVVKAFLAAHPEFAMDWPDGVLPDKYQRHATSDGLMLWPERDGTDAFYIARMKRKA